METQYKFRVYAKILGYMLPSERFSIKECVIEKMSLGEQKRRKFEPINTQTKGPNPSSFYKSYVSFGVLLDTRIFKTEYVVYTDISTNRNEASHLLGLAVRRFDKVIGALSLASSMWFAKKYNRDPLYKGTTYQLSRIYELVQGKERSFGNLNLYRGGGSQINLPDAKANFNEIDLQFIEQILNSNDKVFLKSKKYLLAGEDALYKGLPPEKIILDHMKSIEIIVKSFSKKRNFRAQLQKCAKEILLTDQEQNEILQLWKNRSNGDIAHSTKTSRADFLPPQFPIPSDAVFIPFPSDLTVRVLLKYLQYKKGEVSVVMSNDTWHKEGSLINVNMGSYYIYKPMKQERRVVHYAKKAIAAYFDVKYRKIITRKSDTSKKHLLFKIKE